jgi:hypothetical protein
VSLWDRFIAWLNAEEPPPKTAEPPASTLDPDTERYSQELETKLDRTVQDLADGIINRAQFENLYRHYQNQRRMVQGLVAEGSDQVPDSMTAGESMIIRQRPAFVRQRPRSWGPARPRPRQKTAKCCVTYRANIAP